MEGPNQDLWTGGAWEHSGEGQTPIPAIPVPPRPVLRVRKRRSRRTRILTVIGVICGILLGVAIVTLGVGAVIDHLRPSVMYPWIDPWDFGDESEEQEFVTDPPDIPQADIGTGVTVDLKPAPEAPLTYQQIYEKNLPSMVSIRSSMDGSYAGGTGIVLTADGYLLTNGHVVAGADKVTVTLSDNSTEEAELVGFDPYEDLAVLKIEAEGLTPAEFGDSFALECGDPVAAIGDPLGYRATITDGIVSALDREVEVEGTTMVLIQTSAAINFGNSGGALINQYGQVVGITTIKIVTEDGSAEGLGFAIPSQRVKYVADALIDGRKVHTGAFGFTVYLVPEEGGGLRLQDVDPSSDAWEKGLRSGDIVTAVNGDPVLCKEDLIRVKQCRGPGDVLTLTISRKGEVFDVDVALVEASKVHQ